MMKNPCLKRAPRLRNDPIYKERKEKKKLVNELKNRKEKGEKDIIIRHGHIVKIIRINY